MQGQAIRKERPDTKVSRLFSLDLLALATPRNAIIGTLLLSFTLTLFLVLNHVGALGVDGGAYVLSAKSSLGQHVPALDISRPPLAPGYLLAPFIRLFGLDTGYKLFTAIGAMAIFPGFILFARRLLRPWPLAIAVALLSVSLTQSEMIVTGVLPLMGFGVLFALLWAITDIAEHRDSLTSGYVLALGMPLLALVNQTATGIAAIVIPVYLFGLWKYGGIQYPGELRKMLGLGLLASLVALPWYIGVLPGGKTGMHYPGAWLFPLPNAVTLLHCALLGSLAILAFVQSKQPQMKALALVSLVVVCLMPWGSHDESLMNIFYRSRYLAPGLTTILTLWSCSFFPAMKRLTPPLLAGALVLFLALIPGFAWEFHGQAAYSDMITPDMQSMIDYIKANPNGAVITNGWSLSLWEGALAGQDSYWIWPSKPPVRYQAADVQVRTAIGWVDGDIAAARRAIHAGYVLVDARHQVNNPARQYGAPKVNPWFDPIPKAELLMANGTAKLWRLE